MNLLLWAVQLGLAAIYTLSGALKLVASKDWLVRSGQTGVLHFSVPFIRFIAAAEIVGAVGLILPWLTGIAPRLTSLAAAGLAVIMVGATGAHIQLALERRRPGKELGNAAVAVALLAACVLVATGRG